MKDPNLEKVKKDKSVSGCLILVCLLFAVIVGAVLWTMVSGKAAPGGGGTTGLDRKEPTKDNVTP
ncbi:hypothetical protein FEM03_07560 [Phragmitibacter flavus]|uniref:Uncharacterized protein n=1 Tax=Phragmitibacter flavus TaxID=2576071 RepID=A0A5R8KID4_9BACT|nr:hypothetical protein [Phragmitibacter flavus]TLD71379.1 hypothetical protein FEM03_07560 [Phragmitibacter flavus]